MGKPQSSGHCLGERSSHSQNQGLVDSYSEHGIATMSSDPTTEAAVSQSPVRQPACKVCKTRKVRCDRPLPCFRCQRENLQCTIPTRKCRGEISDQSTAEPVSGIPKLRVGEQFALVIRTLLVNGQEEVLRLALLAWVRRDCWEGETTFQMAMEKASQLLRQPQGGTPGYLAATILLATISMYKSRVETVKTLLRSIKALVETRNESDFQSDIGQQLLPVSRLFIIYGAMAWQEDVQESAPIWNESIGEPPDATELRQLASLPQQIRSAMPEGLLRLAQSTVTKIQDLRDRYSRAQHLEQPPLAELLTIYCYFCLEIFERSDRRQWYGIAQYIIAISSFLQARGLRGHCVTSYPQWHIRAFISGLEDPKLATIDGSGKQQDLDSLHPSLVKSVPQQETSFCA